MGFLGDKIFVDGLRSDAFYNWVELLDLYGYSFETYLEAYGRYEIIEIDTRSISSKDNVFRSILIEMEADGATITYN